MFKVFYHCYLANNWQKLVKEQINELITSGMYQACEDITVTVSGEKFQRAALRELLAPHTKFVVRAFEDTAPKGKEELLALKEIYEYANSTEGYKPIFYFHTKGISHQTVFSNKKRTVNSWRDVMTYFTVYNWDKCLIMLTQLKLSTASTMFAFSTEPKLSDYFRNETGNEILQRHAMYSGNFWWTTTDHIRRLPDPSLVLNDRTDNERWLFMCSTYLAFSFFQTDTNLYDKTLSFFEYEWTETKPCNGMLASVGMEGPGYVKIGATTVHRHNLTQEISYKIHTTVTIPPIFLSINSIAQ